MSCLPLVLLPPSVGRIIKYAIRFPNRIGAIFGPATPPEKCGDLPFGFDNGRFVVWSKGKKWDASRYWEALCRAMVLPNLQWIAVPDVVADARQTIAEYHHWSEKILAYNQKLPLAVVVQDGMIPYDVNRLLPKPHVVFVGGTTNWKWRTLGVWCKHFPRVHLGRVNGKRGLWAAHRAGVESTDGTGWFRGDQLQLKGLVHYLEKSSVSNFPSKGLVY